MATKAANETSPKKSSAPVHCPVFSRRSIDRRLLIEKFVTLVWFVASTIPLVYLIWYSLQPTTNPVDYASSLPKDVVFPALAGVCSGVGAIVAIFLPLTLHQFNAATQESDGKPEEQFRRQWLMRLQSVTKRNVFVTIFVLLADTVLVLLSIGKLDKLIKNCPPYLDRVIAYAALGSLVFGLSCFFLQLFTLGVREAGNLDRVGRGNLLQNVPWFAYIQSMLFILATEAAFSLALGLTIVSVLNSQVGDRASQAIFDFCLVIWLPLLAATLYTLLTSKRYRDLWKDRFLKKWGERAGLGLVCNFELPSGPERKVLSDKEKEVRKVLLNRQDQEPFRGMWLIPGGYINKSEGDGGLHETVCRRLGKLTGLEKEKFFVQEMDVLASPAKEPYTHVRGWLDRMAKRLDTPTEKPKGGVARLRRRLAFALSQWANLNVIHFSPEYSEAVLRYSHAPTDTWLYRVTRENGEVFLEKDIATSRQSGLRWWSLKEIEATPEIIPAHMWELLRCMSTGEVPTLWRRGPGERYAQ